jgi:hypothetical protein
MSIAENAIFTAEARRRRAKKVLGSRCQVPVKPWHLITDT